MSPSIGDDVDFVYQGTRIEGTVTDYDAESNTVTVSKNSGGTMEVNLSDL